MTTRLFATIDSLRAAITETVTCSLQELQSSIGRLVVTTSDQLAHEQLLGAADRSVYDQASLITQLLSDRIPAGQEAQAAAEEVLRWHGSGAVQAVFGQGYAELIGDGAASSTPFVAGDKVFVKSEQKLATVLNVYGDGLRGSHGDIRLDLSGNTPIDEIERYDSIRHAAFDHTFIPIRAEWKATYGITQNVPLRSEIDRKVSGEIEFGVIDSDPGRSLKVIFIAEGEPLSDGLFGNAKTDSVEFRDLRDGVCVAVKHLNASAVAGFRGNAQQAIFYGAPLSVDDSQNLAAWAKAQRGVIAESEAAQAALGERAGELLGGDGKVSKYTDPANMNPAWSNEHCEAAQREGWGIFDTHGSNYGPWQVQRFDDASEVHGAQQLRDDETAWQIVVQGTAAHHEAARQFIRTHSPKEWAALNQREVANYRDPNLVYEAGSDDTFWNSKVIRDGERFNVQVYDADGDRRPDREDSFADQALAVAFADRSVLRFSALKVSNYTETANEGHRRLQMNKTYIDPQLANASVELLSTEVHAGWVKARLIDIDQPYNARAEFLQEAPVAMLDKTEDSPSPGM